MEKNEGSTNEELPHESGSSSSPSSSSSSSHKSKSKHMKHTSSNNSNSNNIRSSKTSSHKRKDSQPGGAVGSGERRSKPSDFEFLSRLGRGAYGVVYKVRRKEDGEYYVIKVIPLSELDEQEQMDAIKEVRVMADTENPYVVKYYDSMIKDDQLYIVMEYCNRGDVNKVIKKLKDKGKTQLSEERVWSIFVQTCIGLHYLHSKKILHRDMKGANVFLHKCADTGNHLVKIGDLGVARIMGTNTDFANTIIGTPYYLSPELCEDKPYNHKSDVWALGILMYEMCTFKHPFEANNQCVLMLKILKGTYDPIPEGKVSGKLRNMVHLLLTRDHEKRPSMADILSMPEVQEEAWHQQIPLPPEIPSTSLKHLENITYDMSSTETRSRHGRRLWGSVVSVDTRASMLSRGSMIKYNGNKPFDGDNNRDGIGKDSVTSIDDSKKVTDRKSLCKRASPSLSTQEQQDEEDNDDEKQVEKKEQHEEQIENDATKKTFEEEKEEEKDMMQLPTPPTPSNGVSPPATPIDSTSYHHLHDEENHSDGSPKLFDDIQDKQQHHTRIEDTNQEKNTDQTKNEQEQEQEQEDKYAFDIDTTDHRFKQFQISGSDRGNKSVHSDISDLTANTSVFQYSNNSSLFDGSQQYYSDSQHLQQINENEDHNQEDNDNNQTLICRKIMSFDESNDNKNDNENTYNIEDGIGDSKTVRFDDDNLKMTRQMSNEYSNTTFSHDLLDDSNGSYDVPDIQPQYLISGRIQLSNVTDGDDNNDNSNTYSDTIGSQDVNMTNDSFDVPDIQPQYQISAKIQDDDNDSNNNGYGNTFASQDLNMTNDSFDVPDIHPQYQISAKIQDTFNNDDTDENQNHLISQCVTNSKTEFDLDDSSAIPDIPVEMNVTVRVKEEKRTPDKYLMTNNYIEDQKTQQQNQQHSRKSSLNSNNLPDTNKLENSFHLPPIKHVGNNKQQAASIVPVPPQSEKPTLFQKSNIKVDEELSYLKERHASLQTIISKKKEKYITQLGKVIFYEIYDMFIQHTDGIMDIQMGFLSEIKKLEKFIMERNGQNIMEACDLAFNFQMLMAQELQLREINGTMRKLQSSCSQVESS